MTALPAQNLTACHHCSKVQPARNRKCQFCHLRLPVNDPQGLQRTWCYLLTALFFYFPANLLPIMSTTQFGSTTYATISSGVVIMWQNGSTLVAVIIFVASVFVPIAKFIALTGLCLSEMYGVALDARHKIRIYRVIEFVGRWSMVDVFVVGFLAALIQMGNLMTIYPGSAALAFGAMVFFSMLAANSIDPVQFWRNDR